MLTPPQPTTGLRNNVEKTLLSLSHYPVSRQCIQLCNAAAKELSDGINLQSTDFPIQPPGMTDSYGRLGGGAGWFRMIGQCASGSLPPAPDGDDPSQSDRATTSSCISKKSSESIFSHKLQLQESLLQRMVEKVKLVL